jgi:hypothetical protein
MTYALREGKEMLVGGMVRMKLISGSIAQVASFISPKITIHICKSQNAVDLLKRKTGTFLYPPHIDNLGTVEHPIMKEDWIRHRIAVYSGPSTAHDDIAIGGLGWFSVYGHGHKTFEIFVPKGVHVYRRPALIPKYIRIHGTERFSPRNHGRSLGVNKRKKEIVKRIRDDYRKCHWRKTTSEAEDDCLNPKYNDSANDLVSDDTLSIYNVHS